MAVVIECPSCQRKLRLPAKKLGHPLKCPACSHLFTPPAGPSAPGPAADPLAELAAAVSSAPSTASAPPPVPEAPAAPPETTPTPPTDSPPAVNGTAATSAPPPPVVETTLQPVYAESSWLLDSLFFRKMITPLFIQLLFWGSLLLSVFGGAAGIVLGLFAFSPVKLELVLVGFLLLVPGPVLIRVGCELLLVVFLIYDTLMEIKRNTTPVEKPAEPPPKPEEPGTSVPAQATGKIS